MAREQRDESELYITGRVEANATAVATMDKTGGGTALAPAGVTTSTIAKWLKVNDGSDTYYIPMWT